MKLSDIKIGDIVGDHEILDIFKVEVPFFDKIYQKHRTYKRSTIRTRCCTCSYIKEILPTNLNHMGCGHSRECSRHFVDHTGKKFGKLTVLGYDEDRSTTRRKYWKCLCECGSTTSIIAQSLTTNKVKNCNICGKKRLSMGADAKLNRAAYQLKLRAKNKELEMTLSNAQIIEFFKKECAYCDSKYIDTEQLFKRNGVDRLDNTKGYTVDNSVSCCTTCNTMKMSLNKDDFLQHIEKIYNHNKHRSEAIPKGSTLQ